VARKRLLYVSSNHSAVRPGGLESYTQELYESLRGSEEFEPLYIARAGPPFTEATCHHGWSPFAMVNGDPNQYLFYTNTFAPHEQYDVLFGTWRGKQVLTRFFRDFLRAQEPDIVHFQHTLFLGYDVLRVTKNTLPGVPIVHTLHEYLPICHRDGQMVRRNPEGELCQEESPRRCNECFPDISPQSFMMRKRFIQSHMGLVDLFLAPNEYVRDQYVAWGLPAEKIEVEPQGMMPVTDRVPDVPEVRPRNRFAYFGQLNPYKGADVLLDAMGHLGEDFDGHLTVFGANLEIQPIEFRERVEERLQGALANVTFAGPYDRADMGKLMAGIDWVIVPSIWWETGPLVVMEAFQYGRPVICSDIGGMSKRVTDGVNGLHFRRRDAIDLARKVTRAAETPGLWDELRKGIPPEPPRWMHDHVRILTGHYRRLLDERVAAPSPASLEEVASA
jgi:glycosyltransferase involved in cell wall biosynthesis